MPFCSSVDEDSTGFVSFGVGEECCLFKIKQVTVDGIAVFFFFAFVGSGFSDHGSKGVPHE